MSYFICDSYGIFDGQTVSDWNVTKYKNMVHFSLWWIFSFVANKNCKWWTGRCFCRLSVFSRSSNKKNASVINSCSNYLVCQITKEKAHRQVWPVWLSLLLCSWRRLFCKHAYYQTTCHSCCAGRDRNPLTEFQTTWWVCFSILFPLRGNMFTQPWQQPSASLWHTCTWGWAGVGLTVCFYICWLFWEA